MQQPTLQLAASTHGPPSLKQDICIRTKAACTRSEDTRWFGKHLSSQWNQWSHVNAPREREFSALHPQDPVCSRAQNLLPAGATKMVNSLVRHLCPWQEQHFEKCLWSSKPLVCGKPCFFTYHSSSECWTCEEQGMEGQTTSSYCLIRATWMAHCKSPGATPGD